ncbi:hypothetical protein GW17_00009163, partial [Ensete ventricosum]
MAEVLRSPSHFPSSPRRTLSCDPNDASNGLLSRSKSGGEGAEERRSGAGGAIERKRGRNTRGGGAEVVIEGEEEKEEEERQQLSVLALLLTVFRKSLLRCKTEGAGDEDFGSMDIGWPTDVRHVAHVTFDRFDGFLGLPVEFEPEVHRRAPSARSQTFLLLLHPLTALMYAVQVMNFLRMLILRTLKDRQESTVEDAAVSGADPSDEDGRRSPQMMMHLAAACSEEATERAHVAEEAVLDSLPRIPTEEEEEEEAARSSHDGAAASEGAALHPTDGVFYYENVVAAPTKSVHAKTGRKGRRARRGSIDRASLPVEKSKGISIVNRINSKIERVEAW